MCEVTCARAGDYRVLVGAGLIDKDFAIAVAFRCMTVHLLNTSIPFFPTVTEFLGSDLFLL